MIESISTIKIDKNTFHKVLFSVFLFFALFTPSDSLGIKLVSFIILLLLNIGVLINFFLRKKNLYFLFFIVIFPLILSCISLLKNPDIIETIKYFYIFSYLLLIPICKKRNINYTAVFINILNILSLIIVFSSLLDAVGVLSIASNPLLTFLQVRREAQISVSQYAIFYYVIFLNASPLILVSLSYHLFKKNTIWSALSFLALLFSGTRANIYFGLIVLGVFLFVNKKIKFIKPLLFTVLVVLVIRYSSYLIGKIEVINWAKSSGDNIRSLNIQSILDVLDRNPIGYIFGLGARTFYYSSGRMDYVNESELTYLELLRQIGLIGLVPLIYFWVKPLVAFIRNKCNFWLLLSFSLYLVKSAIDPFLFTSTGFLLVTLVYFEYENIRQIKE
ncbi:O-antigen ligase family protein [Enterococcus asini]|uniref:O-antigen ligase family protein n=1 Tax=Enterococcus asini TaxID=57732 RepID=UPI0032C0A856